MPDWLFNTGDTSKSVDVFLADSSSTTGAGLAALAYNTANLKCYYRKNATGTATAITLATQTVGGAWSSGGFVEIDATNQKGAYRFDIPDTVLAAAGYATLYFYGATNLAPRFLRIQIAAPVNVMAINSVSAASVTTINANIGDTQPINFTGTGASALVKSDMVDVAGAAVSTSTAQIGVNVVNFGGSAGTFASGRPEVNTTHIAGTAQSLSGGHLQVNVAEIAAQSVTASGTITFPAATLASTTNITAGTITTVTTVTNQLTTAQIATGLWTDTTAGDFTVSLSVGKSIMNGVALGTGLTINGYTGNTPQTGDSFALIGATGSGLTSLAPSSTALSTVTWTGSLATALTTLAGHDPGATLASQTNISAATVTLSGTQSLYAPAKAGDSMALTSGERNSVADALLARNIAGGSSTGRLVSEAFARLRNRNYVSGGTLYITTTDDTTVSWSAALTTGSAAVDITNMDPG